MRRRQGSKRTASKTSAARRRDDRRRRAAARKRQRTSRKSATRKRGGRKTPLVAKVLVFLCACVVATVLFNSLFDLTDFARIHQKNDDPEQTQNGSDQTHDSGELQSEPADGSSVDNADAGQQGEPKVDYAKQFEGCYYFDRINKEDREKYIAMYRAFSTRKTQEYPNHDNDDAQRIFQYVNADHPELFYVDSYQISWVEGEKEGLVEGNYCYTEAQQAQYEAEIIDVVKECEAGIPDGADDFEKARYVYDYLVDTTTYNHYAADHKDELPYEQQGGTVVNCLLEHSCVCSGYSAAYQVIMSDLGIPCTTISGDVVDRGSHAWNAVELDGDWYYVDSTWGDYEEAEGEEGNSFFPPHVSFYGYLCVTGEDLQDSRTPDDWQILPDCTATKDNYYVHEGLMLDSADGEQIIAWCQESMADGSNFLQFRCSNQEVYDQVKRFIEEDLANAGGFSFSYSCIDDVRTVAISI